MGVATAPGMQWVRTECRAAVPVPGWVSFFNLSAFSVNIQGVSQLIKQKNSQSSDIQK